MPASVGVIEIKLSKSTGEEPSSFASTFRVVCKSRWRLRSISCCNTRWYTRFYVSSFSGFCTRKISG